MTTIEDRLQELGRSLRPPDLPTADQGRGGKAASAPTLGHPCPRSVDGAGVGAARVRAIARRQRGRAGRQRRSTRSCCPTGRHAALREWHSRRAAPTNAWDGSVLVSDLEAGFRATYPDGAHSLDFKDAADIRDVPADGEPASTSSRFVAAALTANEELIAGVQAGPVVAFPAGRSADGQHDLVAGGLEEPGREILRSDEWVGLLPTESSDAVWIQTNAGDLELVDAETGNVRQSITRPSGSRLVDVVGDNAVAYNDLRSRQRGRGIASGRDDHPRTARNGIVSSPPARHARSGSPATGPHPTAVLVGVGETVLVVADDGDTTSCPVPAGAGGRWAWLGSQTGIGSMRTLTSDDSKLLLTLTDPSTPTSTIPTRLAVVDIEEGTADIVFEDPDGLEAFWARDDRPRSFSIRRQAR